MIIIKILYFLIIELVYYLFQIFNQTTFTVEDLFQGLKHYKEQHFASAKAVESSLKKDLNCVLRMYSASSVEASQVKEESIDSPFRELGLIQPLRGPFYQFNHAHKPHLDPFIIAYACLDFAESRQLDSTLKVSRLLQDPGCPGFAFKLSESALYEALEYVLLREPRLQLSEAAGLSQLSFKANLSTLKFSLLERYYARD